jgi:hypothetical protein
MANKFENVALTLEGRALVVIIEDPAMIPRYRDLSAQGRPAVQAVVDAAGPVIAMADAGKRDVFRQFCGYWVGQVMRRLGYRIGRSGVRVTVKNTPITTGTVWTLDPQAISVSRTPPDEQGDRVELRVYEAPGGAVMAEWRAVQFLEPPTSPEAALAAAKAYALQHGFRTIVLDDPAGRLAA